MFGPSTRAPKFSTQMPQLFIIKICYTIKVNSVCGASRDTRGLCHKFNSQGPSFRILGVRVASPNFQGPKSRILNVRLLCPRSQSHSFPGLRVLGPRVSRPQGRGSLGLRVSRVPGLRVSQVPGLRVSPVLGLRVPDLRSRVLILDYAFKKWHV